MPTGRRGVDPPIPACRRRLHLGAARRGAGSSRRVACGVRRPRAASRRPACGRAAHAPDDHPHHAGIHRRAHPPVPGAGPARGGDAREDDEVIAEIARMPLREALAMIRRGDIVDSKSICGLHLAGDARGGAVKVGLTGFPGAGKTTVFAALTGLGRTRATGARRWAPSRSPTRASTPWPACTRRRR